MVRLKIPKRKLRLPTIKWLPLTSILVLGSLIGVLGTWYQNSPSQVAKRELARRNTYLVKAPDSLTRDLSASQLEGTHQVFKIDEPLKAELATMPNGEIPEYFVMRGGVEIDLAKEDISLSKEKKDGKVNFALQPGSKPVTPGLYGVVARDPETKFVYYQEEYAWGVFAFNTDYSVYRSGSNAKFTFGVLDDRGRMICDAAVMVAITDPKGNTTYKGTGDGTIRVNEQECSTYGVTSKPDYEADYKIGGEGTYSVKLTALTARGERTFTDSFEVKDNLPVYIQRIAATRIYPVDNYTNTLRIESDNSGEYTVTEKVPAVFGVTSENGEVTPLNGASQLITWKNITIGKGEAVELSYTYDAPDISPYFYRVGKAEVSRDGVVLFSESRTWQIASDEPGSANGARLWTSGFELQSTTAAVEYTTNIGGTSIDTTTKRSGAAALGVTSSGSSAGAEYDFATANTADGHYVRAYFYVTSLVLNSNVIELYDSGNTVQGSIRMDTTDLKLCNIEDDANCASPVATASNVLNINTWYMIELKANSTTIGTTLLEMKMDGVSLGSGTVNWANGPMTLRVGVLTSSTSGTIIVDDVAINDDSTTDATIGNWVGEGKVVHIKPNEDGTGVSWNNGAGTACSNGAADCWDKVNEVVPDGTGTDYITAPGTCSTASTMDFQLEDSATAGIGSQDLVRLVTGNIRIQKGSNQANSGIVVTLVDSANVDAGSAITMTNGTILTNDDTTTTANPTVTSINRPGTGTTTLSPWTTTTIDSMQIRLAPAATDCSPVQNVSTVWVQVEYASATGGRMFSSGFELQSITAGMEWTAVTNTPAIDTTTKRTGAASLRATGWTSATAELVSATLTSANADGPYYFRSYFYVTTLPAAATENRIMSFRDSGGTDRAYITITDTGTLKLYDEDGQVGSASSALSTSTWYRIEMQFNRNAGTNGTVEAKIDGTSFATSSTRSVSSGVDKIVVGGNLAAAAITAGDWYFDDIAVNTNSGSAQTSYPGAGKIIHLRPNADGTNVAWTNTYTNIDDVTPNDATDLVSSSTLNQIEEANVDSFTAAPNSISSGANITLVSAGVRFNSSSTGVSGFKVTLRDAASTTPIESNQLLVNSTTWKTNTDSGPLTYPLTAYTKPNVTSSWTAADLDVAQVGLRETTDTADTQQVSALWLLVEYDDTYTISGTSNTTGTVKWAKNASVQAESTSISGSAWTLTLSGSLAADDIITVWIDGAADGSESTAVTKYASGLSVSGMVLNSNVLSVGSNQNTSVTVTNLDQYDCASDEDVMHRVNASTLEVEGQSTCAGSVSNSYTDETIRTLSSNTLTIGGTETLSTHNVLNDGSLTSGGASTYTISGSWDNNSDYNASTETITFTSTGSETIDSTGASDLDVNSVVFNGSGGAWTLSSALTVNGDMRVTAGTVSGAQNVTVSGGDLDCGGSCGTINFTGGTTTVTGTGNLGTTALNSNWTFSSLTLGGTTTAQGGGTITVTSVMTISGTLNAGSKTYALTGSGTPLAVSGTLTAQTSTFSYEGTSATEVKSIAYNDIQFNPASGTPTYTLSGGSNGTLTKIDDATVFSTVFTPSTKIQRNSSNNIYVVLRDASASTLEVWKSSTGTSWTQQDVGDSPTGDVYSSIATDIDSNDVLHVAYANGNTSFKYLTFDTSTDQFGSVETIFTPADSPNNLAIDLVVDSSDIPHVATLGADTVDRKVRYTNRIGGTWKSPVIVQQDANLKTGVSAVMNEDNVLEIAWNTTGVTTLYAAVGNQNDATSFTTQAIETSIYTTFSSTSIHVDSGGNTLVTYWDSDQTGGVATHADAASWATWSTSDSGVTMSYPTSVLVNDDVYVFYSDGNSDYTYQIYDGSGWTAGPVLHTGTYSVFSAKREASPSGYGSDYIDYLILDGSDPSWSSLYIGNPAFSANNFSILNSTGTATVNADTNDPTVDVNGDFTLSKGTFVASGTSAFNIGGSFSNCSSCTFTHSSATVTMDAGSSGKTITTNGDPFYNLTFNNASGGWTFSDNITIANVWTITAGTVNGGSATIALTGSGTPFVKTGTFTAATSTVSFEGTSATTVASVTYNNIQFNPPSGTPTYTLANAGSDTLTSSNFTLVNAAGTPAVNADTSDPILDINGNFAVNKGTFTASGTAALTVAGNFTVGTTSTFDHSSATVTLDGTASAALDSGCSDTDACTSQDLYNLTINKTAAGASDDNVTLTSNGIRVTNTLTITDGELIQGALNARVEGASAVSIASAGRWTNISTGDLKLGGTFVNAGTAEFDSANAGECVDVANDIVITSTSAATQRAWSGAGTFELYNLSVTDMTDSSITAYTSTYSNTTWTAGSCGLEISGVVYMANESTIATSGNSGPCDGSTAVISVRVDGGAATTTTCSATTAAYTISILPIPTAGQTVAVYLTSTMKANAVYLTGATTDTGIDLYENRVVVAHTNAGPMTVVDMIDYDNDQNATDMLFDAEDATPDTLTMESGTELHVLSGDTFTPGGTVNAVNVHIAGILSMGSNPLNISGDYTNNGTFTSGTSITTFTATTAGKNISGTLTGSSKFYDLVFNGVGGEWTTNAAIETGNDYTVTNGSIVTANNNATIARDFTLANTSGVAYSAGSSTITVTRNYSDVGGKLTAGTSTLTMNGTGAMDIANAYQFYNLNVAYTGFTTTMDASVQTRVSNDMTLNGGTMTGSSSAVEFMISANNAPLTFNAATTINGSGFNYFTFGTQSDSVVSTISGGNYGSWPIFASYSANNSTHQIGGAVTATHLRVYTGWPTNCSFNTQGNSLTLGSLQLGSGGATVAFNTSLGASAISLSDSGDAFFTESSGGTYPVDLGSSTITTNGHVKFVNGSGSMTITPGTSTIQWTNTSGTATYAPNGQSLYNMVLNGSGGTVSPTAAVDVNNNFTITAGTYDVTASNYNLTVGGNFSNSGTYNSRANTTTFDATDTGNTLSGTMTGSSDFNALTFNGSGGEWTLSNDVATASDLTVTAGTLLGSANVAIVGASFAGNGTVNLSTPGAVTMTGNAVTIGGNTNWSLGSLNIGTGADADDVTGDGTGSITIAGVFTIHNKSTYNAAAKSYILTGTGTPFVIDGSFGYDTSTIDYAATGSQIITSTTYYNLDISAASGTPTKTLAGNITVSNNLTNDANNTLDVSATNYTIALAGNYTNNGTFTARNGTVTLTDTGTQTLNGTMTGSSSFYNLTKNGVGGTVQPSAAVRVGNNFTIAAGTYDTVSGSNYALTVGGNYSNSGTFTANSATVTFDATDTDNTISGTLNGTSSFYKVVFNGTGGAWTIQNAITATADATDTFKVSAGTVTMGNGNGDNLEVRGKLLVAATADETATFQTAAVAEGSSITIDINQNNGGSPTTCTNCGITVGASSGSGQGNFKLAKNTVLRLNPRTDVATDIGLVVQSTGYLEVLGAQDYTGTSTGATETTLTDTGKSWATDENNGKHVRMTSGLAEGRVYPITDTTATVLTRATTASASQTMTVSGSGETRTICASADTVITADDQFAGRYVYDQTGTTGLFQIISSINNDAVCPMTEDSFEVIETPGAFTALTTTNTFTIVDGVQSGDSYEVLDYAHITAEAGTACSATASEAGKGEGYVLAASGSQTLLRYAELCNLGRSGNLSKSGLYVATVDNSQSNNGLVVDTVRTRAGYHGSYLFAVVGSSISDLTVEDQISHGVYTAGLSRGEMTDVLVEDAGGSGLFINGANNRFADLKSVHSGSAGADFTLTNSVVTGLTSLGSATYGLVIADGDAETIYKNVLTAGNAQYGVFSGGAADGNTYIDLQSIGNERGVYLGTSMNTVVIDSLISNSSVADIEMGNVAGGYSLYNTTLGSSNPVANVTNASAYIISRKAEASGGATKIWGDYAVPTDNTKTPQTESIAHFSYAKNLWEKSIANPGYNGTGTEDASIDLDLSATDLSAGPYTYHIFAQAGGNANCATPTTFTVYRNGSSVGTATCGTVFTDTNGGVNVKFKIEGGATGYAFGDSYTFTAFNADNSMNTAKTVTLMQDGDTITVGSGKTLEAKGASGNATAFTRGGSGGWHMSVAGTLALQNFTMSYLGGTSGAAGLDLQTGATVTTLANGTFNNFQSVGATDTFVTIHGSLIGTGSPSKILSNLTFTQATAEPEYSVTVAGGAPSNGNFWTMYPTTCTGWASCEASDSDSGDGAGAPNQDGFLRFLQADLVSGRVESGTIRVPGGTVRVE